MKQLKRFSLFMIIAVLLASCGSINNFSRKQHSHRVWKKTDLAEAEDQQGSSREASPEKERNSGHNHEVSEPVSSIGEDGTETNRNVQKSGADNNRSDSGSRNHIQQQEEDHIPSDNALASDPADYPDKSNDQQHNETREVQSVQRPAGETSTDKTNDDLMTIILVVLALIGLPWLSMLLYEGATTRFWLVLLLSVLGYGWFYLGLFYVGIALFVAIVWTILVVLGFV